MTITTLTAEKPFDFASTPGKLPKQVVPEDYSIRIVPDIEKRTFAGSETVKLNVREPAKQLVLNALEIKINKAIIDGKSIATSAIRLDEKQQTLTLVGRLANSTRDREARDRHRLASPGISRVLDVEKSSTHRATDRRRGCPRSDSEDGA